MIPKLKNNLLRLAIALAAVTTGYALGQPPAQADACVVCTAHVPEQDKAGAAREQEEASHSRHARGVIRRHLAMPFVSIAALAPRQES